MRWVVTALCGACGVGLLVLGSAMDAAWFDRHMLLPWFYPWAPAGVPRDIRITTYTLAGALFLLAWPLGRMLARSTLGGCVRVALAVVLALASSEVILRRRGGETAFWRATKLEFRLGRPDARFGWVLLPSRTTTLPTSGTPVLYAVDAWGDRAAAGQGAPVPDRPSLVIAGESVAVGHAVPYEQTFAAVMGNDLGLQVVNVACGGYGSDQALLRLQDALGRLRRPVVVVTTFVPVMLSRNLQDYRPRLALRGGALTLVPPADGLFARLRVRDLLVNEMPYFGETSLRESERLTAAILRETARAASEHGAEPLFAVLSLGPQRPPDAHPEWWLVRDLFVDQGLPFVLIDVPHSELVRGDGHPDGTGHRRIAAALEAALRGHVTRAE